MYRLPINKLKVKELVAQCKHLNIFPIFLSHYFPKSEPNPVSDLLSELIEESVVYLKIMSQEEVSSFVEELPLDIKMFLDNRPASTDTNAFLERIALYNLVALTKEEYISYRQVVNQNIDDSEVIKIYPEIRDKLDKDNLLYLDKEFKMFDGGIEYKDHILHYHQFLRRGYYSNPNFDFLSRFRGYYYQTRDRNRFRIAIDHHRIMPREFYQQLGERDVWYGPKFDKQMIDDRNAIGFTVHKRSKPSLFDMSGNLEQTEFYWSYKNGIKTFEIEEVSGKDNLFDSYYLNRYFHAERDINEKILRHCDGAVKVYLQKDYEERIASTIPREFKSFKKVKLFRIDGDIDVDEWIELLSLFYKGNEMIIEYFNPEQFEVMFGKQIRHYQAVMRERNNKNT